MENRRGGASTVAKAIYIDLGSMDGPVALLRDGEPLKVVCTGLTVHTERDDPLLDDISRLCGLHFLLEERPLPLYGVPCLYVFARDGADGWFACVGGALDSAPVCYIDSGRLPHTAAPSFAALLRTAVADPDWRRKHLPGNWPRLPEDRVGRDRLAAALKLPPPTEQAAYTGALPRVFASRQEAQREFPILDMAEALRQEERFQVRPMATARDREGRAFVHYTAWQETYTGILDSRILARHTLEHCREASEKYPENTLVLVDRAEGERVVGFACYEPRAREFVSIPDASELSALYLLEAYQGRGLGRLLVEACLTRLRRPKVALYVLEGNEKAIGFYGHMGFQMTGHRMTVQMNGGEMDELEMVLDRRVCKSG